MATIHATAADTQRPERTIAPNAMNMGRPLFPGLGTPMKGGKRSACRQGVMPGPSQMRVRFHAATRQIIRVRLPAMTNMNRNVSPSAPTMIAAPC